MTTAPGFSFEFFPPASEVGEHVLWRSVDTLAEIRPRFVSVTYGAGGSTRSRSNRILDQLMKRTSLEPAAHLTCVGASCAEIEATADRWWRAGIRRIVALRGDPPRKGGVFEPHPDGYRDAAALVAGLRRVGEFDIAVAAYPETHPESPTVEADLDNLKRKIDAGASSAITQFFFEPETFLRFRDRVRAAGITAPIVPGILPIVNFAKAIRFAETCGTTIPSWLSELFQGTDDSPNTRALIASAQATELCQQLRSEGVDAFHFYTLNRASLTLAICRSLLVRSTMAKAA